MKYKYTYPELQNEMSILENTFPIVRLVDPVACRVVRASLQNGILTLTPESTCYQVWDKTQQCTNCISARALLSGVSCTKFECMKKQVFQIICRYILLEDTKLILEMGTDISDFVLDGQETQEEIEEGIHLMNQKMVTDPVTSAFQPHYIEEHLLHTATNANRYPFSFHLAIIGIDGLEEICRKSGSLAGNGILRAAAESIRKYLPSDTDDTFLAVYNDNSFLYATGKESHDNLKEKLLTMIKNAPAVPILFAEKPLSLQLCAGLITCASPEAAETDFLLHTAYALRQRAGQLPDRFAEYVLRP